MLKKHSQIFEHLFVMTDMVAVTFSWIVSYWIRFSLGVLPIDKGVPPLRDYLPMLIFVWLIWITIYRKSGLYKPTRGQGQLREIFNLIKANALAVILLMAATYLFKEKSVPLSRLVFLIFWGLQTTLAIFSRVSIRIFFRRLRKKGFNLRYALIVGAGPLAQSIGASILSNKEFGIELVGFLSRTHEDRRAVPLVSRQSSALNKISEYRDDFQGPLVAPVIGVYSDLLEIIERGGIDQIIVALPLSDHDMLESVVSMLADTVIDVKLVPDIHQFIQLGSEIEEFNGLPVVSLASTPLDGVNRIFKRVLDIVLGTIFFVIFTPLMIFIAVLVKLTSPGPLFFTQERVGLDGKSFNIIKFRTMRIDAEKDGAQFAKPKDARVTPIGGFLRSWSLDELPQLANVILGNMSLVGPRPERPVFIREFRQRVPKYMLRHKVQAGMTGWAQVNGWRGNTSIEKRIEHDLFYIENWSLSLDLKILSMTILKGFRNKNAY